MNSIYNEVLFILMILAQEDIVAVIIERTAHGDYYDDKSCVRSGSGTFVVQADRQIECVIEQSDTGKSYIYIYFDDCLNKHSYNLHPFAFRKKM